MVLASAPARATSVILRAPAPYGAPDPIVVVVTIGSPPLVVDGCQILELAWSWGAASDDGVLTTADAGQATLRLYDPNRLFDPTNASSPNAGLNIGSVVSVTLNGTPAYTGRVDDIAHDLTIASFTLVDRISSLAGVAFVETSVPAETSSARVKRILDLAKWPSADRDISSGGVPLQAGTVAADAWTELVEATRNELGAVWISPAGRVVWRSRSTAWAGGAPVGVFGCSPTIAYIASLATRSDQSSLVNELTAARRTGTAATVIDPISQGKYGRHTHVQNDLELATDGDRDLWSAFYLTRQAEPAVGIAGFTFRPDAAAIATVLGLELGQLVTVYDEHHGPTISRLARWVGASWTVSPVAIDVTAVTGEDASIGPVARELVIDTPAEWAAVTLQSAPVNAVFVEPGITTSGEPAPSTLAIAALELAGDALRDAARPTPSEDA